LKIYEKDPSHPSHVSRFGAESATHMERSVTSVTCVTRVHEHKVQEYGQNTKLQKMRCVVLKHENENYTPDVVGNIL